jgi:signal transduction histidine kinase
MVGLALLATGVTSYLISSAEVDGRIAAYLAQEVDEFETLARDGVDPQTGRPFTAVEQVLSTAIQRNVPDDDESLVTFVDGVAAEVPFGDRPVALDTEPEVVALVRALPPDARTTVREVGTASGPVRLAAVQIRFVDRPDVVGTYVVGVVVDRERDGLVRSARTYAVVAVVLWIVIGVVAFLLMGRLLRPISLLRGTARRISRTDLSERIPVDGRDDVSNLAATFNDMLDRLETAFVEQQVFLDDAGHELRTPVTILRGHLELLDPNVAAEVADTRELLLDEVDRMGRLVEDLILLAKARRADFVIPGEVAVGRLVDGVLDKSRGFGNRQWVVDARAEVVVVGDEQRLTQALLQLVDNAVKHTCDGDLVAVGSALVTRSGGTDAQPGASGGGSRTTAGALAAPASWLRLWVRDSGSGIAEADSQRVFERFGRAETGRGVQGSGLGLSIVAAIAAAHGGHVELTSRPGNGALFTLVLPATGPASAPGSATSRRTDRGLA